jgi:hypothetical protein
MKKLFFILLTTLSVTALAMANKPESSGKVSRNEKKLAKQELVKEAVETKSFAIRLDRLYMSRYGVVDLFPDKNYIIIDGNKASIRAGYAGRQHGLYPVAGIRLTGEPSVYKMSMNRSKGNYKIEMELTGGSDTFHVILTISENGTCSALISGVKIDDTRYSGDLIPIEKEVKTPVPDAIKI